MKETNSRNRKVIPALFFKTPIDGDERIFGLDIMRASAVAMAVGFHGLYYFKPIFPELNNYIYFVMMWAIVIFFVLSGFIIGNMIIKMYLQADTFTPKNIFAFWKRRWIRTLPVYYFMILVNLLLLQVPGYKGEGFSYLYLIFMQNLAWRHPVFFPETWSLTIEEWFYFLLPLTLALFSFIMIKLTEKKTTVLYVIIFSILLFTSFRFYYVINYNPEFDWALRKITIYQLDGLLYGVFFAWLFRFYPEHFKAKKKLYFILGIIDVCLWYVIYRLDHNNPYIKIFWFTFTSLGFAATIPYLYYFNISFKKTKAMITHVSLLSYSSSMIYLTMIQQTTLLLYTPNSFFTGLVNFIGYVTIVITLATLMYNFFERPILLLRK